MNRENVASAWKVAWHREKVAEYCRGESIGPVTLEMDLTSRCTRTCDDCPSCRTHDHHWLEKPFIERLFAVLQGRTSGLLLTGGEPTLAELFPWTLAEARRRGFAEIAVVTNGSLLEQEQVAASLLEHATTIRVSLYDWDSPSCAGAGATLRRIEQLRSRIEAAGSQLKIGVSLLTSAEKSGLLVSTAEAVRSAGADWVYFHPVCFREAVTGPTQRRRQQAVLRDLQECRREFADYLAVHFLLDCADKEQSAGLARQMCRLGATMLKSLGLLAGITPVQLRDFFRSRRRGGKIRKLRWKRGLPPGF